MFSSIVEAIFYYAGKTPDTLFAADSRQSFTYEQAKNEEEYNLPIISAWLKKTVH